MVLYHTALILLAILWYGKPTTRTPRPNTDFPQKLGTYAANNNKEIGNFFATTVSGLETVTAEELKTLCGAKRVSKGKCGVYFSGDAEVALKAIMHCRTALRIMEKVTEAENVQNKDDLYALIASVDWIDKLPAGGTLKCDTTLGREIPAELSHNHFCSLTVKNAVVDQFRNKLGSRPNVDLEEPDLPLLLYLHRGAATLYRVWSGEASMHKRGYKSTIHKASLRETTAAALVLMSAWNWERDIFCDPMCGSGTIAIEAALLAAGVAPGTIRFSASEGGNVPVSARWPGVDLSLWDSIYATAKANDRRLELSKEGPRIFANDRELSCVETSIASAGALKIHRMIDFSCKDATEYRPKMAPAVVVTNPPWDRRIQGAEDAWRSLGEFGRASMKKDSGELWALTGNTLMTRYTDLPVLRSIDFNAAAVDMRFTCFKI